MIEAMIRRDRSSLAYLVVSAGGLGGVGETLHALDAEEFVLTDAGVSCDLTGEDMGRRPVLAQDQWPPSAEGWM